MRLKTTFILAVGLFLQCGKATAQISIGYGLGYFPGGMSRLYTEQAFYLESSYHESQNGPLTKSRKLLPFHHGLSVGWQSGGEKNKKAGVLLKWTNLHNAFSLERTNPNTKVVSALNQKSRLNNYLFGGVFRLESEFIRSWSLAGLLSQHSILNKNTDGNWEKSGKTEGDFGVDAGIQLNVGRSATVNLHYTRCFFLFSAYNPSFLGLEFNIYLSGSK